jgi:hypothetical protein
MGTISSKFLGSLESAVRLRVASTSLRAFWSYVKVVCGGWLGHVF